MWNFRGSGIISLETARSNWIGIELSITGSGTHRDTEGTMERIRNLVSKAEQSKSLATISQPSQQPEWGALLWTLAQSKYKELTPPEIALFKAKLSGYPNELVEWALINYSGEYFPDASAICRMIEQKRQADYASQEQSEWQAWKAKQAQAESEGQLATEEQYQDLRDKFKAIANGPKLVRPIREVPSESAGNRVLGDKVKVVQQVAGPIGGGGTESRLRSDVAEPTTHNSTG